MSAEDKAGVGGGAYEPECRATLASSNAKIAIVIVIGGDRGNGFSVAGLPGYEREVMKVPDLLRKVADSIEQQQRVVKNS